MIKSARAPKSVKPEGAMPLYLPFRKSAVIFSISAPFLDTLQSSLLWSRLRRAMGVFMQWIHAPLNDSTTVWLPNDRDQTTTAGMSLTAP